MTGSYVQRFPGPLPAKSCIRCLRGGVDTFFVSYGDGEWVSGVLMAIVGLDADHAMATVEAMRDEHGTAWDERYPSFVRLCAHCATKAKVAPTLYTSDEITRHTTEAIPFEGYNQTDEVMADYERWRNEP